MTLHKPSLWWWLFLYGTFDYRQLHYTFISVFVHSMLHFKKYAIKIHWNYQHLFFLHGKRGLTYQRRTFKPTFFKHGTLKTEDLRTVIMHVFRKTPQCPRGSVSTKRHNTYFKVCNSWLKWPLSALVPWISAYISLFDADILQETSVLPI